MLVTIWGQLVEVTSHLQRPKFYLTKLNSNIQTIVSIKKNISEIFKSTRVIWRNVFLNKS